MIKIGIAGIRGLSGLLGFRSIEGVSVEAMCDIDADLLESSAKKYHIPKTYRVFDDMIASDVDAVVVATPMQCHVEQSLKALNAGKHVLSEVTAGVSMDELFWLCDTYEKQGKVYMMAENYCYTPQAAQITNMIKAGLFGDLYFAEGEYLHNLDDYVNFSDRWLWRKYWQLGTRGCFYPTHSIGPVMTWFKALYPDERILELSCFGTGSHTGKGHRQDDTTLTLIRLSNDRLVKIRVDCLSPRPHNMHYYSLQGTKGVYEAPRGLGDTHKIALDNTAKSHQSHQWRPLSEYDEYLPERYRKASAEQLSQGHNGGDFFIIQDFIEAVRGNCVPTVDVYDACEWSAVAILSNLSCQNGGKAMKMPDFKNTRTFVL